MFAKMTLLAAVAGVLLAFPSDPYSVHNVYKDEPMPHNFAYAVNDHYSGNDFGHSEDSNGREVKGVYSVQLPDGRKQTVNYVADHYNGYQADVSYYGEAQHPRHYGPAVTYRPNAHPHPTYN